MRNFILAAISTLCLASPALAQSPPTIQPGIWRAQDGSVAVRIGACQGAPYQCAVVVEEKPEPGEQSTIGQTVVRDIRPNGKKGWVGKFVDGKESMAAKISLAAPTTLKFKVCAMAFLCDTIAFNRISN